MFKSRKLFTHLALVFAVALIAAACGGSSSDGDVAAPGAEAATEQATTTEAVMEDDHSDDMTEHMEGDDHEESEHMEDAAGHEEEGHDEEVHDEEGHEEGDGHDDGHSDGGAVVVDPSDVPEDARVVFVTMDEWGYDPGEFTAKAGETVVFRITNTGIFAHEFRLSNAHRIEEHIASGHEDHGEGGEGGHHSEDGDILIEIEAGSIGELVVTFPTDTSVFTDVVCLIPDHYENGMFAELTYEA